MVPFCTDITEVVIFSRCYLVLHRVLQLIVLRFCSREFKELEIVVLRHELAVLRRARSLDALIRTTGIDLTAAWNSRRRTAGRRLSTGSARKRRR
jgi:hypothetical protein